MKKIVSIISAIALLCTMFSLPVMAEDVNVAALNTQVRISSNVNTNASAYGFTDVAPSTHILVEKGNGTHAHNGVYYKTFDADAMAAPMPVNGIYSEAESGSKSCVDFTAYSSIWGKFKALTYNASDRIYFSAYVSNLDGKSHGIGFMPSSGGVVMSPWFNYTFPSNRWTKLDVVYDPNVTYTFTVDGASYTVNSVGKTLPTNGNLGYAVTSTNNAANAEKIWTPILALGDMTYNAGSTYIIKSVKFGETKFYIDGSLAYSCTGSYTYSESANNFYFYDAVPSRLTLNGIGSTSLSNMKFGKITNFDESTFDFGQPEIVTVAGKFTVVGNKIYAPGGFINKADIVVPDGAVMKAYVNASTTAAAGYKCTEVTGDTIPVGSIVTIQENKNGGERICYDVVKDHISAYDYSHNCDSSTGLTAGNSKVAFAQGLFGKAEDDKAVCVIPTGASEDPNVAFNYGMTNAELNAHDGYLHVTFNVCPENVADTVNFKVSTDQGNTVAANSDKYKVNTIFNQNQWNRVDLVINLGATGSNSFVKTYVNGKFIGQNSSNFGNKNSANRNCVNFRIGMATKDTNAKLWIDDYKAYSTYIEEPVPSAIQYIEANIGDTVASVTAQGAKVFKNDSYKETLEDDAKLSHGNVVLKATDGTYAYTVIEDTDIKHYMTSNDSFASRVRYSTDWSAGGIGGKSMDDVSLKLTKHAHESDSNYINFYPQFEYNRADDAKKFVVIALNFYAPSESKLRDFGIYSQQHTNLGVTIDEKHLARDKWHSVVDVIEYTDKGAKATMYLNGNVYGEAGRLIGTKKTSNGEVQQFGGSIFNQIRLSVVTGELMDTSSFYMDDIIVYETDEAFVPGKLAENDAFTAKYDLVEGDRIYLAEDVTVAEVKAAVNGAVVIRSGEVLADDVVIAKGDVIRYGVVDNYVNNLSAYKALVVSGDVFGNDGIRMYKYNGSTTVSAGDKIKVRIADGGILVVAGYDADGTMDSVNTDMTSSASYKEVTVPEADTVSFIAVDGFENLKPLCENYVVVSAAE